MEYSKHLPAELRRAATVEAVIELAAEQNPGSITTASIAERMGVTQGALFRHFPSKDAIRLAVMNWVADRLLQRIDEAQASAASPLAALQAIFMAHAAFVTRHPGVPRMIFGELQEPKESLPRLAIQTLLDHYATRLHDLLEAGKAQGELDPGLDVAAASIQFLGTIQGLVTQSLLARDPSHVERHAARVLALYIRGIRSAT